MLFALLPGAPASAQSANADPPGRVGRISYLSGPVQLVDSRDGASEEATLNWPITSGLRLAAGHLGRAEVHIGSLALRLDDDTEVEFTRIDDEAIQINALRGSLALRVRNRELLRELDLLTPRERIVIEDIGRYRIDVDRSAAATSVTAFAGQVRILSGQMIFTVASGQRGDLGAAPGTGWRLGAPMRDPFDDWVAARERRDDAPRSAHYVSPEMTGVEALDEHGAWRVVDAYGAVWFPAYVPSGWAPYRYGRWAYIAPWGWTWIDEASWGFAPFHYGRWIVINGVWGWVPGVIVPRPVYAPALVAWFGTPGVSVSIGIGAAVGWFPLGPHEIFIPPYRSTRRHVNLINVPHVTNIMNITVINPPAHFIHREPDRTTWVPGNALLQRGPIHRVVMPPPADWNRHAPSPRSPLEPPRDIKKHPTPVPMPGHDRPFERAPQSAQPIAPGAGPTPAPAARPAPHVEEPRRPAHPQRPEIPAARTPAPNVIAPAPAVPRVAPDEEQRRARPADDEAARVRRPAPAPQVRQEPVEPAPRVQDRERGPRRVVPQPPPAAPTGAPPIVQPPPRGDPGRANEHPKEERQRARPERDHREAGRSGPHE